MKIRVVIVASFLLLAGAGVAVASGVTGYSWGENVGWLNWGTPEGNITIPSSGGLTGYVWGENIGWISLNCSNTDSCTGGGTLPNVDFGVTRTGTALSGYAWGENVGWISFSCANTASCGTVNYGVSIDGAGTLSGYAWGENIGWISMNCTNTGTCGTVSYAVTSGATATATPVFVPGGGVVVPPVGSPSPSPTGTPLPGVTPTASPGATPTPIHPPLPSVSPPVSSPPISTPTSSPSIPPPSVSGPIIEAVQAVGDFLDRLAQFFLSIFGAIFGAPSLLNSVCQGPLGVASCGATGIGLLAVIIGILAALTQSEAAAVAFSFLQIIGLKKRAKVWGTIYDSSTKRPVPFARVELLDASMRVLETRYSDRDGRYGFVTSAKSLNQTELRVSVRVSKPGYRFPSATALLGTDYVVYDDVYRGGELVLHGDAPLHHNIPLDATAPGRRSFSDFGRGLIGTWGDRLLSLGFWIGLVLVPLNVWLSPTRTNIIIFILFFLANGIRMFAMHRPYGITRDAKTNKPLAYALVTLNDAQGTRTAFTVSDEHGRYILSGERGKEYNLHAYTPANVTPQREQTVHIRGRSRVGRRAWFTMTLSV